MPHLTNTERDGSPTNGSSWRPLTRARQAIREARHLPDLSEIVLNEARSLTGAESGTIYLTEGDSLVVLAAQNEVLARRLGPSRTTQRLITQRLPASRCSLAGYVAVTGKVLNVPDAYRIPPDRDYLFDPQPDAANMYRTRSVLAVPIRDEAGEVLGVLQLINARDNDGPITQFHLWSEYLIETVAGEAGQALRRLLGSGERPVGAAAGGSVPALVRPGEPADGAPAVNHLSMALPPAESARTPIVRRLGELLTAYGLITQEELQAALAEQKRTKERLGSILVRHGLIEEGRLVDFLSRQYGVPAVSPAQLVPDPDLVALVPAEIAMKHEVMPVERSGPMLTLAMADPNNFAALADVAFVSGLQAVPAVAALSALRAAIERAYQVRLGDEATRAGDETGADAIEVVEGEDDHAAVDSAELRTSADQAPIVRLVNTLLVDAIRRGASDVHLEPREKAFAVRFRVDGLLQHVLTRAKRLEPAVVSRIKIMANLDISERRRPQDGHIKLRCDGREIDLRVSILPSVLGEAVSVRILDRAAIQMDLAQLGFDGVALDEFRKAVRSPYGLVLITGPTGSGKTTTLYAVLRELMLPEVKILTVEDPVEYTFDGITQAEVNEPRGWTFPAALRSFLRHDPDVILVGEMRDLETAQIATRAALTGHLVLSTLHTNDCPSTIARLVDMGIPNFLVSYTLRAVVAQRLVRRLCSRCREPYTLDEAALAPYGYSPAGGGPLALYRARGCESCRFTGMRGRVGFFQLIPFSEEIRRLTMANAGRDEIERVARQQGMKTLREVGFEKVLAGLTTVEELLRATAE